MIKHSLYPVYTNDKTLFNHSNQYLGSNFTHSYLRWYLYSIIFILLYFTHNEYL